jgi:transposase
MEETKSHYYKSYELSDEYWEAVKDEIPEHKRDENRTYQRKPGAGRKPPDKRKILQGIFYILRTGCQWKALPAEYGKGSNTHRYFQLWEKDGFFQRIWAKGLEM